VPEPIGHHLVAAHKSAAFISVDARPRLAGAVREPRVIPIDVRIRLVCGEAILPAKAIPSSTPASGPRPIGALLDCYM